MYRIGQEEKDALARVIDSGELFKVNNGNLQETKNFEIEIGEKFGAKYSLLMTSGHAALTSALIGLGIGPGDEVIVPAYELCFLDHLYANNLNNLLKIKLSYFPLKFDKKSMELFLNKFQVNLSF